MGRDFRTTRKPQAFLDGVVKLEKARRDKAENHHARQAAVEPPEAQFEEAVRPGCLRDDMPYREEHQGDGEHAVHAE